MIFLSAAAAIGASLGWATGIVLAQAPARAVGAFEFTRIQLIACGAVMGMICFVLGSWRGIDAAHWPAFSASIIVGIVLGNLAMIECLRQGGPRRTEILLSLKAPAVALMAYFWFGETLAVTDALGGVVILTGLFLAIRYGEDGDGMSETMPGAMTRIVVLGLAATTFQGFGFLAVKPAMLDGADPIAVSAIRLLGAAFLISLLALWPARAFRSRTEMTPKLLGRVILPGFIGYGISSTLLLYAFATMDSAVAAVLGSLSPVLVLPILWIRDRRRINPPAVMGALLCVVGTAGVILL